MLQRGKTEYRLIVLFHLYQVILHDENWASVKNPRRIPLDLGPTSVTDELPKWASTAAPAHCEGCD
jgi:hypothetical protein